MSSYSSDERVEMVRSRLERTFELAIALGVIVNYPDDNYVTGYRECTPEDFYLEAYEEK